MASSDLSTCACPACGLALRLAAGRAGLCPRCAAPFWRPADGKQPARMLPMRSPAPTPQAASAHAHGWGLQPGVASGPREWRSLALARGGLPWGTLTFVAVVIALLLFAALGQWPAHEAAGASAGSAPRVVQPRGEPLAGLPAGPSDGASGSTGAAAASAKVASPVLTAGFIGHAPAAAPRDVADAGSGTLANPWQAHAPQWAAQIASPSEASWRWIWPRLLVIWVLVLVALIFGWVLKN